MEKTVLACVRQYTVLQIEDDGREGELSRLKSVSVVNALSSLEVSWRMKDLKRELGARIELQIEVEETIRWWYMALSGEVACVNADGAHTHVEGQRTLNSECIPVGGTNGRVGRGVRVGGHEGGGESARLKDRWAGNEKHMQRTHISSHVWGGGCRPWLEGNSGKQ